MDLPHDDRRSSADRAYAMRGLSTFEREVSVGVDSADHYMHDRVRGLRDGTEPLAVAGGEARKDTENMFGTLYYPNNRCNDYLFFVFGNSTMAVYSLLIIDRQRINAGWKL